MAEKVHVNYGKEKSLFIIWSAQNIMAPHAWVVLGPVPNLSLPLDLSPCLTLDFACTREVRVLFFP